MEIKKFVEEIYLTPVMKTVEILPNVLCAVSGDSTHEGVDYDDDEPLFGGNEE